MVRPSLVIADPEAMTGQPEQEMRASAMNALAHGADTLYSPFSNPVSEMSALRGAELIASALGEERQVRERADLACGAILCGYAIDSAGLGLHHVICQTLVRVCGTPHAETNAAVLPGSMDAMRARAPDAIGALAEALGTQPERISDRIETLAGGRLRLGELGADRDLLDQVVEAASQRPELARTPDPPSGAELSAILHSAW